MEGNLAHTVVSFLIILILTLVCFFLFRQMEPPADPDAINVGAFVTMMLYCMAVSIISTVLILYIAGPFFTGTCIRTRAI